MGFGAIFLIGIPRDQINFLPDFKQVNTYPLLVILIPAFLHDVPGFGEAASALTVARSGMEITKSAMAAFAFVAPTNLIPGQ